MKLFISIYRGAPINFTKLLLYISKYLLKSHCIYIFFAPSHFFDETMRRDIRAHRREYHSDETRVVPIYTLYIYGIWYMVSRRENIVKKTYVDQTIRSISRCRVRISQKNKKLTKQKNYLPTPFKELWETCPAVQPNTYLLKIVCVFY